MASRTVAIVDVTSQLNLSSGSIVTGQTGVTWNMNNSTINGATGTILNLGGSVMNMPATINNGSGVLTLPTTTTTLVGTNTTNILTNKTINGMIGSNTVVPNYFPTNSSSYSLISGTATNGQFLSYNGSNVTWATLPNDVTTGSTATSGTTTTTLETISYGGTGSVYLVQSSIVGNGGSGASAVGFVITGLFYYNGTSFSQIQTTDTLAFVGSLPWSAGFSTSGSNIL